jgi:hypothetical protein
MPGREPKAYPLTCKIEAVLGVFTECAECRIPVYLIGMDEIEHLLEGSIIVGACDNCGAELHFKLRRDPIDPKMIARAVVKRAKEMRASMQAVRDGVSTEEN